jgi:Holliday junction resolvase
MSGRRSKQRGKRGEREVATILRENGHDAKRGWQVRGGANEADVISGSLGRHVEVKYCERLNIYDALAQAERDSQGKQPYVVVFRRNRTKWFAAVELAEFLKLVEIQQKSAILSVITEHE